MTFRPSDDVLEQMAENAQLSNTLENQNNNEGASSEGSHLFYSTDDINKAQEVNQAQDINQTQGINQVNNSNAQTIGVATNPNTEEIKSPDLSELLNNNVINNTTNITENTIEIGTQPEQDFSIDLSGIQSINSQNINQDENNSQSSIQSPTQTPIENSVQNSQNGYITEETLNNLQKPDEPLINTTAESQEIADNQQILGNQQNIDTQQSVEIQQNTAEPVNILNPEMGNNQNNTIIQQNPQEILNGENVTVPNTQENTDNQENINGEDNSENIEENVQEGNTSIDSGMTDEERINFISSIEGSIHSNLDLLVNPQRIEVVNNYKKIHRIVFKRGIFIMSALLGISAGIFAQVKANQSAQINIINSSSSYGMNNLSNDLSALPDGIEVDFIVPYGYSKINGKEFQTKSNLVSYQGIILPEMSVINNKLDQFISLNDFENKEISRSDLENLLKVLVTNDSLNKKMNNIPNTFDNKGQGQNLQGGLIDGFSLGCMFTTKVSDVVCNKFLDMFYKYGKYYNLSSYSVDLLKLTKEIRNQHRDIEPICTMIKEYTLQSSVIPSDVLGEIMKYCPEEDQLFYKKIIDFIDVENSLQQPELPNKVFNDPNINAYKLLSAQQNVYKILEGSSINTNFIVSYLNYVQNLINKDKGTHHYLGAIYTDLLYVFNMDELYDKLLQKGELTTDLKTQIDQINNGNYLMKNESLLSQITTKNIILSNEEFDSIDIVEKTLEDIFSQYYAMTDRLKIRKVSKISDTQLKVQAEIFSENISSIVRDNSLKATISLYRRDNVLYIDKINIANQPKLSEVLNVYASSSLVTFYAMIGYIDEQVGFWYEEPKNESELEKNLCEQLRGNGDIVVYNCDESRILLYVGSVDYNFTLENGILKSFTIGDPTLEKTVKDEFEGFLFNKDNTPMIIKSIINYQPEQELKQNNVEKKLQIIDQFRIHFKLVPDIYDIPGEDDIFLVEFKLGEFTLQANYDINTHLLTKISYLECDKILEIRKLNIEISAENEEFLTEILNNPRIFLTNANPAAFKKYLTLCNEK